MTDDLTDQNSKSEYSEYIDIAISILTKFEGQLPFDIYVKRTDVNYTKIFKRNDTIDEDRIIRYRDKGINSFYVLQQEHDAYLMIIKEVAQQCLGSKHDLTNDEVMLLTKEMINFAGVELIQKTNIGEKAIGEAITAVHGCVELLSKDPKSLTKVIKLMTSYDFLIKHSTIVSILSIILAKTVNIESESNLLNIGLGAFLHDIGITQISFNPEEKETYTPSEWKEMKSHPELGKTLLDGIPGLPGKVRIIVLQHHEQLNGNGYPNGIREFDIYMPAKIVAIADRFTELVERTPYKKSHTPINALKLMQEDQGKFDQAILRNFTSLIIQTKTE